MISISKVRDGSKFPELFTAAQNGLAGTPSPVASPAESLTFLMKLPVAVHLPLSLGPVAAVGPERGFLHGHHRDSWAEQRLLDGRRTAQSMALVSTCAMRCSL